MKYGLVEGDAKLKRRKLENKYQKYIDVAILEILQPTLESTEQILEVNAVELENQVPKVIRVDESEVFVSVYFAIKNEKYFLEIQLNKESLKLRDCVFIQNAHRIYFTATSEEFTYIQLSGMVNLIPLSGWSKEDTRGKTVYGFSRIRFEPILNIAYELNEKLNLLLDELEKDAENIILLSQKVKAEIVVVKYQYVSANAGIKFDIDLIQRLAKLNLGVDIDIYIVGKEFIS